VSPRRGPGRPAVARGAAGRGAGGRPAAARRPARARRRAPADASGVRTLERAARVVEVLAEGGRPLGVTEVARRVGLQKSTTHRLLTALSRAQLARADAPTRRYTLGFRLLRWTAAWLDRLDVRTRALPHLRELREKCQETVSLNLRDGGRRVAVERLETSHELRFVVDLGHPAPLHVGAGGKAILAFLPEREARDVLDAAGVRGPARRLLLRELGEVRRLGSAVTRGERIPGSASVSAPVFNHEGRVIGSLSILSLAVRMPEDVVGSHRELVRQTADAISRQLGWSGGAPGTPGKREAGRG
jgi:IclR family acetate operon transcriptional repressor